MDKNLTFKLGSHWRKYFILPEAFMLDLKVTTAGGGLVSSIDSNGSQGQSIWGPIELSFLVQSFLNLRAVSGRGTGCCTENLGPLPQITSPLAPGICMLNMPKYIRQIQIWLLNQVCEGVSIQLSRVQNLARSARFGCCFYSTKPNAHPCIKHSEHLCNIIAFS